MFECPLAWKPWRDRPSRWIGDSTVEVCDGPWHPHGPPSFTTKRETTSIASTSLGTRPGHSPGSRIRKPSVKPVDQAVRFVELMTQAGHPAPGNHGSVTLHPTRAGLGRFDLLRD